jgi:5-formyltetrahydrofolate cyclo-ligase
VPAPDSAARAKAELRRALRARRLALPAAERRAAAERLAAQVARLRLYRASRRIALYLANDGEIDPAPLGARAAAAGKRCYLPVLSRLGTERLWFAPAWRGARLRLNRFGIPEPQLPMGERVRAGELDLILVPLVGFDPAGNRLGMGGGFYDRSLEFLGMRRRWRKPHLVGLAYELQRLARLPAEPWDIPLAAIVTERGVYFTDHA